MQIYMINELNFLNVEILKKILSLNRSDDLKKELYLFYITLKKIQIFIFMDSAS